MDVFTKEEKTAILDLLGGMLRHRPEDRLSVEDILESERMVKWALPDFERIPD